MKTEFANIKPLYIGVEGPGGGGKSTAIKYLSLLYEDLTGREVVVTREPGGTPFAEKKREEIFAAKKEGKAGLEIVEMFYDARVSTVNEVVKPNLRYGRHVITDRFAASTRAYECAGMDVSWDEVKKIHRQRLGNFGPDITYYLSVPLEIGLGRKGKQTHNDSFDLEERPFHEKVWREYDKIYQENSNPKNLDPIFGLWILIDANQSLEKVRLELQQKTREYLTTC